MRLTGLAMFLTGLLATPAVAAEYWWTGWSGKKPNRVIEYIERDSLRANGPEVVQVWSLSVEETARPDGTRVARVFTAFNCKQKLFAILRSQRFNDSLAVIPTPEIGPTDFHPIRPGSIAASKAAVACGKPTGLEIPIEDPVQHAYAYLTGGAQPTASGEASNSEEEQALGSGTGFFVGSQGLLLTSHHVVENARTITVLTQWGEHLPAVVVKQSSATDLAVLRVNRRPQRFLGLAAPGALKSGDRVFTVGYPVVDLLGANEPRFTDGAVSALSGAGGEDHFVQISVPVQPGNSGGPLLNESGQVVGVIASVAAIEPFLKSTGTLPQNINWAVKADYAAPLLGRMAATPARSRAEAIALARDAVALILVEQ